MLGGSHSDRLLGITYEGITAENGVFCPCPGEDHPGTPRLFLDTFPTEDGRARFHAVEYRAADEEPSELYPLYLTTGRLAEHYQTGTQTRRVRTLHRAHPEAFVEIHPDLAGIFGIADGDTATSHDGSGFRPDVRLTLRLGAVRA